MATFGLVTSTPLHSEEQNSLPNPCGRLLLQSKYEL
jgi:hypothetical protein